MKRRTVTVALLVIGACVVGGVLIWRFAGPFGPGRKLVGVWEITGTEFEDAVREALEKKDPKIAEAAAEKFRSTQRLTFARNGDCRHVQDLLGLTITAEGTWRVTEAQGDTLAVTFNKKRLTVYNSQKDETQEKVQDTFIEWVVTVVDPDTLSVSREDEGKTLRFSLMRAKD